MNLDNQNLTIQDIERLKGIPPPKWSSDEQKFPLPSWYIRVRKKPLRKLSIDDLCIACRQRVLPEYIVPLAIDKLRKDPLIGHQFDGELIVALARIRPGYWKQHQEEAREVARIAGPALIDVGETFREDVQSLLDHLSPSK